MTLLHADIDYGNNARFVKWDYDCACWVGHVFHTDEDERNKDYMFLCHEQALL
jgi:hypothetical protein